MTPEELLAQSLARLQTANRIDGTKNSYRKDNPAEYAKVIDYLGGDARPSGVTSDMGMGLMLAEDARRALVVVEPEPEPEPTNPVVVTGTNDAAIRSAVTKAQAEGRPLYFPAGTYTYDSILPMTGIEAYGDGPTSVLKASNPASSAVILRGAAILRDLKVTSPNAVNRDNAGAAAAVNVDRASPFTVKNVTVDRCGNTGILVLGASNGVIHGNDVRNTLSDAIHMTNGAHDITVTENVVRNSGDDMIAVVSYQGGAPNAERITIERNDVADQTTGRGISTVGGNNVTIRENKIANTRGAGVYVAAEDSWNTYGCSNVQVIGNTISGTDNARLGHGAVTIFGRTTFPVSGTKVEGNIISNTRRGFLIAAFATGTQILGNTLTNAAEQGIFLDGPTDTTVDGNTIAEIATYGLYAAQARGTIYIRNNKLSNVNKARAGGVDGIHVVAGVLASGGAVTGNTLANPGGYPVDKVAECPNPQITVSGNTLV